MDLAAKDIINGTLADGGPVYRETDLQAAVPEPLNGLSALLFLFIALYWLRKAMHDVRGNLFFILILSILAVGGVGGALFHAFRVARVFFLMDVIPIMLAGTLTGVFLWRLVFRRGIAAFLVIPPFIIVQRLLMDDLPRQIAIMVSYGSLALFIILPILIVLKRRRFREAGKVAIAVGFFSLGMLFRYLDRFPIAAAFHGTHWLWHLFSAVAVFLLAGFLKDLMYRPSAVR